MTASAKCITSAYGNIEDPQHASCNRQWPASSGLGQSAENAIAKFRVGTQARMRLRGRALCRMGGLQAAAGHRQACRSRRS